ncbi:DUF2304 family protein [Candidatus Woesearchaeota archaeon]|nr:DUF2304 family protein [Candidatus Woesearchaeota archaeon]
MIILQIIIVVFVLFALSRVILRLRDKQISIAEFLFWTAVWIGVLVVLFVPGVMTMIALRAGVSRGVDIAIYVGITLLFYLVFRLYVKLDAVDQNVTKLVRIIALERESSVRRKRK